MDSPNLHSNLADLFPPIDTTNTAPLKVQTDSPSILQWYDTAIENAQNSVDDTLDQQALDQEQFKNDVSTTYEHIKQKISDTYDTISTDLHIAKNYTIYGSMIIGSLLFWKLLGKDIYYIRKGK